MTAGALEEFITKGLKGRYLLNPQVTVTIDGRSNPGSTGLPSQNTRGIGRTST